MSEQTWIVVGAAALACLALLACVVMAVALRRTRAEVRSLADAQSRRLTEGDSTAAPVTSSAVVARSVRGTSAYDDRTDSDHTDHDGSDHDVTDTTAVDPWRTPSEVVTDDGRVVLLPSHEQVVDATLGRPMVRGAVLSAGVLHALRAESRDRITGMMRREYRRRRRARLRAGRRAARVYVDAADAETARAQAWLGSPEHPRSSDRPQSPHRAGEQT